MSSAPSLTLESLEQAFRLRLTSDCLRIFHSSARAHTFPVLQHRSTAALLHAFHLQCLGRRLPAAHHSLEADPEKNAARSLLEEGTTHSLLDVFTLLPLHQPIVDTALARIDRSRTFEKHCCVSAYGTGLDAQEALLHTFSLKRRRFSKAAPSLTLESLEQAFRLRLTSDCLRIFHSSARAHTFPVLQHRSTAALLHAFHLQCLGRRLPAAHHSLEADPEKNAARPSCSVDASAVPPVEDSLMLVDDRTGLTECTWMELSDPLPAKVVEWHACSALQSSSSTVEPWRVHDADYEACALLFPAFHHHRFYGNVEDFAVHCQMTDHLLYCTQEYVLPLNEVERARDVNCRHPIPPGDSGLSALDCDGQPPDLVSRSALALELFSCFERPVMQWVSRYAGLDAASGTPEWQRRVWAPLQRCLSHAIASAAAATTASAVEERLPAYLAAAFGTRNAEQSTNTVNEETAGASICWTSMPSVAKWMSLQLCPALNRAVCRMFQWCAGEEAVLFTRGSALFGSLVRSLAAQVVIFCRRTEKQQRLYHFSPTPRGAITDMGVCSRKRQREYSDTMTGHDEGLYDLITELILTECPPLVCV